MAIQKVNNIGGLNLYINPLNRQDGELLRAVNVDSYPYGAKQKRQGYQTFLGTANGSAVTNLWSWEKNDGSLFLYRESGGVVYHSVGGTGAWTISPNGTTTAGNFIGHSVLGDTMTICDGAGSTRYTTNGTSFTDTTLAPVGVDTFQYQNRVYVLGTASDTFYSTTGDATNWNTSGTSDSSSFTIPGGGKLLRGFVVADRANFVKTSGAMFKWDGYSLVDMATKEGLTSPWSLSSYEGYYFALNRNGIQGYGGNRPEIISNAIQGQIFNTLGSAITGSDFDTIPGVCHRYNYLASIGTVTDDVSRVTVDDCIVKYDYQKNEFLNWSFNDKPTAFVSYTDSSGNKQLVFGDANGQCYKLVDSAKDDNGTAISATLEYVVHLGYPNLEKKWNGIWLFFNPGCQATVQYAISDTFTRDSLNWKGATAIEDGIVTANFEKGTRGRLMFIKISESSKDAPFRYYGAAIDADVEDTSIR